MEQTQRHDGAKAIASPAPLPAARRPRVRSRTATALTDPALRDLDVWLNRYDDARAEEHGVPPEDVNGPGDPPLPEWVRALDQAGWPASVVVDPEPDPDWSCDTEQVRRVLAAADPGAGLAHLLEQIDPDHLDDATLVEALAATTRLGAWAHALTTHLAGLLDDRPSMNPLWPSHVGTPARPGIAADEIALRLACSVRAAQSLVVQGRQYATTLAGTGDALADGRIDAARARVLVDRLRDIDPCTAIEVEDEVLPAAGRRTPTQLRRDVERALLRIDPDGAADRRRHARCGRRVDHPRPLADGMAGIWAVLPAGDATGIDGVLDQVARHARRAGDPRTLEQLRADHFVDVFARSHDAVMRPEAGREPPGPASGHELPGEARARCSAENVGSPALDGIRPECGSRDAARPGEPSRAGSVPPKSAAQVMPPSQAPPDGTVSDRPSRDGPAPDRLPDVMSSTTPSGDRSGEGTAAGSPDREAVPPAQAALPPSAAPSSAAPSSGEPRASVAGSDDARDGAGSSDPRPAVPRTADGRSSPPRWRADVRVVVALSTLLGLDEQPADLEGYGPLDATQARALAAGGVWRRIVTDPLSGAVLDVGRTRYRPPSDLAEHVRERDRVCARPGCTVPARSGDLDHTEAFGPVTNPTAVPGEFGAGPDPAEEPGEGGTTSAGNIDPLCRRDHLLKTHAGHRLRQPEPGRFVWTTPTGHVYRGVPGADASNDHDDTIPF